VGGIGVGVTRGGRAAGAGGVVEGPGDCGASAYAVYEYGHPPSTIWWR
jgi:hypothetical protein